MTQNTDLLKRIIAVSINKYVTKTSSTSNDKLYIGYYIEGVRELKHIRVNDMSDFIAKELFAHVANSTTPDLELANCDLSNRRELFVQP